MTAIQSRVALDRDVLIPWNKWEPEAFKSVETLHAADRGGFIFDPDVGYHENVVEVDFASLYPNIMCEFNVSPETVGCDCHADKADVPGLEYGICDRRGFIPDVLQPIIDDREATKSELAETDDPERTADLRARSDALKWILVSCFGYQGYRNAKFGRIECHEAINAFAREILLDAKEVLEASGWRVVHGIVDSLWVTPIEDEFQEPIREICWRISDEVGIRLEFENRFDWVCFVPQRDSRVGALTKYFGKVADEDAFKIRGIEARQRSTPPFICDLQQELLRTFDATRQPEVVCGVLRRHIGRLERGDVDSSELVITTRISKPRGEYTQETLSIAALTRAERQGLPRSPGQDIRYVVVDADADGPRRVALNFETPSTYDSEFYTERALRATVSILAPLGWDEQRARAELRETRNLSLRHYQ